MKVMIIDNYDSFTFNLYQMIVPLLQEGTVVEVYRNDAIDIKTVIGERPTHVVLSPGPGHPAIEGDFRVCKEIILRRRDIGCSLLGVCLGHQGIVHYMGGTVVRAPQIVHGKSSEIRIEDPSPLFDGIRSGFSAMRYHSLVASPEGFPEELSVTAREADHGLIMALQHKSEPIYGVQFHPESIGTPEGAKMLRNFIELC
ncbi:MAG TPA: aminodeoxychorismate/anthranilate synthase component II [Candidatus Obscuribacterales bacterium]